MKYVELYGLEKCSTCQKARAWLDEHGQAHSFVDYREHPIAPARLKQWAQQLGGWEKLVNRASMTWRNLPQERKQPADDAQWLALVAEYPALVRRPVTLMPDGTVAVGFTDKKYALLFG